MFKTKSKTEELLARHIEIKNELTEIAVEEKKRRDEIDKLKEKINVAKRDFDSAGSGDLRTYEELEQKLDFLLDHRNKVQSRIYELQQRRSDLATSRSCLHMKIWTAFFKENSASLQSKFQTDFLRIIAIGKLAGYKQFSQSIDRILPLRDRDFKRKVKESELALIADFDNGTLKL